MPVIPSKLQAIIPQVHARVKIPERGVQAEVSGQNAQSKKFAVPSSDTVLRCIIWLAFCGSGGSREVSFTELSPTGHPTARKGRCLKEHVSNINGMGDVQKVALTAHAVNIRRTWQETGKLVHHVSATVDFKYGFDTYALTTSYVLDISFADGDSVDVEQWITSNG